MADTKTPEQLDQLRAELEEFQKDFYVLWTEVLQAGEVKVGDYKNESRAWRFYIAGRRAGKAPRG